MADDTPEPTPGVSPELEKVFAEMAKVQEALDQALARPRRQLEKLQRQLAAALPDPGWNEAARRASRVALSGHTLLEPSRDTSMHITVHLRESDLREYLIERGWTPPPDEVDAEE